LDIQTQQVFDPKKCINCGRCNNCPTGARETIGYEISIPELMNEIMKDNPFYEQSGGGVTFSGGEPLYQADFLLAALEQCRKDYINTAVDTSGYCDTQALLKAARIADCILYDFKFIDSKKHEHYCGKANDLILKNLRSLAETNPRLFIRIPVIPGINDDLAEMNGIFEFIKDFKSIETVHLLPYHNIHSGKYKKFGIPYELRHENGLEVSGDESPNMNEIQQLFESRFRTKIGG